MLATISMVASIGCQKPEEPDGPPVRKTYVITGSPDPAFAGSWVGKDKMSSLELKPDGTAKIMAASMSVSGRSETNLEGEWRVEKPTLYLKYKSGASDVTLKYEAHVNGDSLELIQAGNNHKNLYQRTKAKK